MLNHLCEIRSVLAAKLKSPSNLGKWGENAGPSDRQAVSVAFRVLDTGPAFMVQDASVRPVGSSPLVSRALDRADVVGHPIAAEVFQICDSIYLADPRINELRA
jgi:hypothetical protein